MTAGAKDLKNVLLESNDEFRELAEKHQDLEHRLHELSNRHYLSEPEKVEEVTLKKRKLQLKDRMESIIRHYREASGLPNAEAPAR